MAVAQQQKQVQFYPCTQCHSPMLKVDADVHTSLVHQIDLTKGAHRGLYCSNCHIPPYMINLVGGAKVPPSWDNRTALMETNRVCATCHPREYRDYMMLIHGNKTYTCPGGKVEIVKGYKDVRYPFHICPEYKNLKAEPARACIECHDPHDPVYKPLAPLPKPSMRPPPPNQENILYGFIASVVAGLVLIGFAFVYPGRR